MATRERVKTPPSLGTVIRRFWVEVNGRLVKLHHVPPVKAKKAVVTYRKRVGNVALNRGAAETAQDIAAAVRRGGFRTLKLSGSVASSLPSRGNPH
jgi:hypothetical protein